MRIAYPDYAQRDQENLCAMGIRGLFASGEYNAKAALKTGYTLMQYQKHPYFDQYMRSRILYDDKAIEQLYNNEKMYERNMHNLNMHANCYRHMFVV